MPVSKPTQNNPRKYCVRNSTSVPSSTLRRRPRLEVHRANLACEAVRFREARGTERGRMVVVTDVADVVSWRVVAGEEKKEQLPELFY